MKANTLQNVVSFIFKYIWVFCALLITLELGGSLYTGKLLMEQTSKGVIQASSGEVSGRVEGVLRLLKGLAKDEIISDVSIPLFDRAIILRPYKESYNLYMMALTDENVNVISEDTQVPPTEQTSLAYRDYMQELYKTGEPQITDVIVAGADGVTLNYTIAVPIMSDGEVKGSIFGAIYFDDIGKRLEKVEDDKHTFLLLGKNNQVMGSANKNQEGNDFLEIAKETHFFGRSSTQIEQDLKAKKAGGAWEWGANGLSYSVYQNVPYTEWTLVYSVQAISILEMLLPTLLTKIFLYILMCALIFIFGRRYMKNHLSSVNHLIDQVTIMQKELFENEQEDFNHILELSQQGLIDQLTSLSTRAILLQKMKQLLDLEGAKGAVMFIDLDDLKFINDHYGHEAGDLALMHFSSVLKHYESSISSIASRYGGDEFIYVIPNIGEKEAFEFAQKLGDEFYEIIKIKEHEFKIHGSIGLAFYPAHGMTPEELICKADLALYAAKQNGKNCVYSYDRDDMKRFHEI